ncbi:hypothetical protein, partial [Salmonella enterica]|uniref:hypothetical protein n=1 Tax=Salmonella enterica TaxID=28901 RepID=UPI0020A53B74
MMYALDFSAIKAVLQQAPMENTGNGLMIEIPTPNGTFETFELWKYDMMEPGLKNQFPEIGTYLGKSKEQA